MNKWNLIVDVDKCCNCGNCVLTVKDEYVGNSFTGYTEPHEHAGGESFSVHQHIRGSGSQVDVTYVPKTCNHCDDAPCIKAAPNEISKREDGIVIIDPVKAKGKKWIVSKCPYGAISWNEDLQLPQQWIFDAHLLDSGWKQPRCVQVCPTGALISCFASDSEMQKKIADERLTSINPRIDTKVRVHYKGLEKVREVFVSGNVVAEIARGRIENVEGAKVELFTGNQAMPSLIQTDGYGDFRIDGLTAESQEFTVRISHKIFGSAEYKGLLADSINVGNIRLSA